jgi:hypothetical protein
MLSLACVIRLLASYVNSMNRPFGETTRVTLPV